ncbi:F-BAR domain only protein 1 isoform X2 [Calypte anna]|uniref:F-BAR domain only protein 1 isoform X2 n=1 Tax=Calypte anna TaxID=9244 RepID=UPI0011C489D6|nr:F-BAR domain only protein 1 isoform X2 [Calypte anna]
MSYFTEHFWGEKNHGFDVLYHNMKHGQISTKELADFVRERAAIEENYAKAMVKLSKMATNGTQLGTFAPLWEVFRISSDKLALCHLELMRKLQDLIKEISRYGEEQGRVHKKSKEEVSGTLEAVQLLQGVAQLLPKSRESYHSKCQEYERLRKEGTSQKELDKAELKSRKAGEALRRAVEKYNLARADFEQRMMDSAMRFQEVEEAHLRHMKGLIGSYSHSVEDTHVQIGQVHEEFKQNVENIGTEMLLRRFAESKGTGRERPGALDFDEYRLAPAQEGPKRSRSKAFRIPGLSRKERERDAGESPDTEVGCPEVDEDGFTVRPDAPHTEVENHICSSSDSDYDEEEPRKFYIHIKPVQPRDAGDSSEATVEQLKATVGNLILPPSIGGTVKRQSSRHVASVTPAPSELDPEGTLAAGDSVGRGCLATQVKSGGESSSPSPWTCQGSGTRGTEGDTPAAPLPQPEPDAPPTTRSRASPREVPLVAPPRRSRSKRPGAGPAAGSNTELSRSLSPSPSWSFGPSHSAPPSLGERGFFTTSQPALGVSRGPSPVVLGSQDALPVAAAFTEYVHAYFKGHDADSCLVKVTGEVTMSFPAGIIRVFSGPAAPPVLSFRLLNASAIEQFLPNAELLYSDPSQSDPSTRDFWLNMGALTGQLQKQAELSPSASYYNVALLKYQFSRSGPGAAPLRLCARWDCGPGTTRVTVRYGYNAGALAPPVPLANVHVLLPVDEPLTNLRLQPPASWNLEEKRLLWKLLEVQGGCGRLSASWEPLGGPSKPSPVAAQFSSEGSTLSGVEVELASTGYRMSLVKKRFATGIYLAGS